MAARKPRLTVINPPAAAADRPPPGLDLSWIPSEPAALHAEVYRLAIQVSAQPGGLRPADRSQLMEYFAAGLRMGKLDALAHETTDPDQYLKLVAQADRTAALRRFLLRDLTVTRAATPAVTSAEAKAKLKSGSQWTGIL
jgi:hypothetical protein